MRQKYLKYYQRYRGLGALVFLGGALRADSRMARLSLMNRYRDYLRLAGRPDLLVLHREMNRRLLEAAKGWDSYDYGQGYFYQSCDLIGVSGLRDTRARLEAMGLRELLKHKTVLEIGCNSGFLALSVADVAKHVVGFDVNGHLIEVARLAAAALGTSNAEFLPCSFEDFACRETFDAVLSFANHRTYDGNTRQPIGQYFRRCRELVKPGGLLLFESHPPAHEGQGLEGVCSIIEELFAVKERRVLEYGTFLDRGRTYIVARRPEVPAADPPTPGQAGGAAGPTSRL